MFTYAGNPNNYPLAISIPDDSDEPNATNFAVPWEGLADRTAYLYANQGHLSALNWSQEFQQSSTVSQQAIAWDPLGDQWMLFEVSAGGVGVLTVTNGLDLGAAAAWLAPGGGFTCAAVYSGTCSDPTTPYRYWVAWTDSIGANNHFKLTHWTGTAWTSSPGAWTTATATGQYYGAEMATLGAYVIAAVAGTDAGDSFIVSSDDGFATWASFGSGALLGAVGSTWYLKSNQNFRNVETPTCVAIQSAPGLFDVYSTTDGHTWTTSTTLAAIAPAGGSVVGLAWTEDANGPCWVCLIETTGVNILAFRSADGISWSPQSGGLVEEFAMADVAGTGGSLVATSTDGFGISETIFSIDGGVTWYPGPAGFTGNIGGGVTRSRIVASATGYMMANGKFARFSSLAGLPIASL